MTGPGVRQVSPAQYLRSGGGRNRPRARPQAAGQSAVGTTPGPGPG